jgi:hypothetical protein
MLLPPIPRRSPLIQDLRERFVSRDWDNWLAQVAQAIDVRTQQIRYRRVTDQSIPNNTTTVIDWNNVLFETGPTPGAFAEVAGAVTVPALGGYLCVGQVRFKSNATGVRVAGIRVTNGNGANLVAWVEVNAVSGAETDLNFSQIVPVTALTDTIEVLVFQTSGGALDLDGTAFPNLVSLTIARLF